MAQEQLGIEVKAITDGFDKTLKNSIIQAQRYADRNPLKLRVDNKSLTALGRITESGNELEKSFGAANARIVAFGASLAIISGVTSAFKALISTTIEVQKQLTDIRAVSSASNESFEKFRKGLFDVARDTGTAFSSVAQSAGELARQGLSVEDTLSRLKASTILARLSGLDFEKSVSSITAALNTFNSEALDAVQIVDRLAAVDSQFAVSSKDLASGLERVSGVAQGVGVNFNQLIALIASLQQRTARGGSVIGNGLKSIFTRIQRSDTQEAFESLGIQVRNFNGDALDAITILTNLANKYDTLTSAQKATVSELGAGTYQINLLKSLVDDLSSSYSTYSKALDTASNAQDNAIQKNNLLNQTLAATLENTKTNITELLSDLGNISVEPLIRSLLSGFNSVLEGARGLANTDLGSTIGKGLIDGIVTYLQSGGLVVLGAVLLKLVSKLGEFAIKGIGSLTGLNKAGQDQAQIQSTINSLLAQGNEIYQKRFAAAQTLEQQEKVILDLLKQQANIRNNPQNLALAQFMSQRPSGRPIRRQTDVSSFAAGYLPINQERKDISRGVGGASRGAKPVIVPNFNYGGGKRGTIVANSDEHIVPNYAGGSAIFNKDMIKSMGLPAGARKLNAAGGFLPSLIGKLFGPIGPKLKPNNVLLPSGNSVDITKFNEGGLKRFTNSFEKQYGVSFDTYLQRRNLQRSSAPSSIFDEGLNDFVRNKDFRLPIQKGQSLERLKGLVEGGVQNNARENIALSSGGALRRPSSSIASVGSSISKFNTLNFFSPNKKSIYQENGKLSKKFKVDESLIHLTVGDDGAINFNANGRMENSGIGAFKTINAIKPHLLELVKEKLKSNPNQTFYYNAEDKRDKFYKRSLKQMGIVPDSDNRFTFPNNSGLPSSDDLANQIAKSFNRPNANTQSLIDNKLKTGKNSIRLVRDDGSVAEIRKLNNQYSFKIQKQKERLTSNSLADIVTQARSLGFRSAGKAGESLGLAKGYIPNLVDPLELFQSKAWLDPNGRLINVNSHPDIESGPFKQLFAAKRQSFVRVQREGNKIFAPANKLNPYQKRTLNDLSIVRGYNLADDNKAFASGYISNFANPLASAIGREKAAGVPSSLIRIDKDNRLKNSSNPLGLAVTNTRDEPGGKAAHGINRVLRQGGNPQAAGIPNFADLSLPDEVVKQQEKNRVNARRRELYAQQKAAALQADQQRKIDTLRAEEQKKELRRQTLENQRKQAQINREQRDAKTSEKLEQIKTRLKPKEFDKFAAENPGFLRRQQERTGISPLDTRAQIQQGATQRFQNRAFGAAFVIPLAGEIASSITSKLAGSNPNDQRVQRGASAAIGGLSTFATGAAFGPAGAVIGGVIGGFQTLTGVLDNLHKSLEDVLAGYQEQINKEGERAASIQGVAEAEGRLQDLINSNAGLNATNKQTTALSRSINSVKNSDDRRAILDAFNISDPTKRQEKLGELNARAETSKQDITARGELVGAFKQALDKNVGFTRLGRLTGGVEIDQKSLENIENAIKGLTIANPEQALATFQKQFASGDRAGAIQGVFKAAGATAGDLENLSDTLGTLSLTSVNSLDIFKTIVTQLTDTKAIKEGARNAQYYGKSLKELNEVFNRALSSLNSKIRDSSQSRISGVNRQQAGLLGGLESQNVFGGNNPLRGISNSIIAEQIRNNGESFSAKEEIRGGLNESLISVIQDAQNDPKSQSVLKEALLPLINSQSDFNTYINNFGEIIDKLTTKGGPLANNGAAQTVLKDINSARIDKQLSFEKSQLEALLDIKANTKNAKALEAAKERRANIFDRRGGLAGAIDPNANKEILERIKAESIALAQSRNLPNPSPFADVNNKLRDQRGGKTIDLISSSNDFFGPQQTRDALGERFKEALSNIEKLEKGFAGARGGGNAKEVVLNSLKKDTAFQDISRSFERQKIEGAAAQLPQFFTKNPDFGKNIDQIFKRLGGFTANNADIVSRSIRGSNPEAADFLDKQTRDARSPLGAGTFLKDQLGLKSADSELAKNTSAISNQITATQELIKALENQSASFGSPNKDVAFSALNTTQNRTGDLKTISDSIINKTTENAEQRKLSVNAATDFIKRFSGGRQAESIFKDPASFVRANQGQLTGLQKDLVNQAKALANNNITNQESQLVNPIKRAQVSAELQTSQIRGQVNRGEISPQEGAKAAEKLDESIKNLITVIQEQARLIATGQSIDEKKVGEVVNNVNATVNVGVEGVIDFNIEQFKKAFAVFFPQFLKQARDEEKKYPNGNIPPKATPVP